MELEAAFQQLRALVLPYADSLAVTKHELGHYSTRTRSPRFRGKPMEFAAVITKSYVSFHFFPVYVFPELLSDLSPQLRKKMHGKTCWKFTKPGERPMQELAALVKAGFRQYEEKRYR